MSLPKMVGKKERKPLLASINPKRFARKQYNDDYTIDADLQSLDAKLQTRIKSILNDIKSGHPPIDLFKNAILFVGDLNGTTVEAILLFREDIQKMKGKEKKKNEESYNLVVNEYLENSLKMLDFCSGLDKFLVSAGDSHSFIDQFIQQIEKEKTDHHTEVSYMIKILQKLKKLKTSPAVNDNYSTSTEKLLQEIQALIEQQNKMLSDLEDKQKKLGKKLGRACIWRKVGNTILISTVVAVFVCTVVTAALSAPPLAAVLVSAISPAMVSGTYWIATLLEEYENAFKAKRDVLASMHVGTLAAKKELGDIKTHIDELETQINSILRITNFAIEGHVQIDSTVKRIKDKLEKFSEKIKDLEGEAKRCRTEIVETREKVLKSIEAESTQRIKQGKILKNTLLIM